MWGDKKTETPAKTPLPQQSKPSIPSATPITGEVKTMAPLDLHILRRRRAAARLVWEQVCT